MNERIGRPNFSQLHHAERLAETLGPRHAEVAADLFLRVAPLLMPDDRDGDTPEDREPGDDRRIVGVLPVAMELDEVGHERLDVVERIGAPGMPRDERLLPRREARVDLSRDAVQLLAELLDLAAVARVVGKCRELLDAPAQPDDRFFEVAVFVQANSL